MPSVQQQTANRAPKWPSSQIPTGMSTTYLNTIRLVMSDKIVATGGTCRSLLLDLELVIVGCSMECGQTGDA